MLRIGFALTSSFCTIDKVLNEMTTLVDLGYDVIPIASPNVIECNTRYGDGQLFKEKIENITNKKIVTSMFEAEKFGPSEPLDALIIAPATGNFIAKLANGITDSTVNMVAKTTLRNQKPVIIGIATNDGLGLNGQNVMKLLNAKNIYFVPFGQDDPEKKPTSLVAHYDLLLQTLEAALDSKQYQPVIKDYQKVKKY